MVTKAKPDEISVIQVSTAKVTFYLLGSTPIILNRINEKTRRELLMPKGRKTAADKASSLKHVPIDEYRLSPNVSSDPKSPTKLLVSSLAIKGAIRSVAVDMPGAAKAQIGRLTYIEGDYTPLYGVPQLFMSVTRNADAARTPDIRTRAIVRHWALTVDVTFVRPILREQQVADLLGAAGIMRGIGDWRPEKGAGSYGQFMLVNADDERYRKIVSTGGRKAQEAALESPTYYDAETADLASWFETESRRRGFKVAA